MARRLLSWAVVVVLGWAGSALAGEPLATAQLEVRGSRLWIYSDEEVDDADQVLSVGEHGVVRTCFGGIDTACGEVLPTDPRVAGLAVRAELRGPQLPEPQELVTLPGGTFVLPAFQQEGVYTLENIRLVRATTDEVLGWCDPPVASLQVAQIAVAYATVSGLSLEDLESRGIALDQENFQAFDFTVGFGVEGEYVELRMPVLYDGSGQVSPLDDPVVDVSGLSEQSLGTVARWRPPAITPFVLTGRSDEVLDVTEEEDQQLQLPLLGAIVMPGSVSFLNQFFEVRLVIANGAPVGSEVDLVDLQGRLRLPSGNVLRVAETDPPVAVGQWLPVLGVSADGGATVDEGVVPPGGHGAASWILEGLVAGTHLVRLEIEGELHRPGRDAYPVATTAQAAVDVIDPGFHLAFTHPDVVRDGSPYSLFVTLTNLSRVAREQITVAIDPDSVVGAELLQPASGAADVIPALAPGASETLEFRFEATVTGRVVAATFETTSDAASGSIRLVTGVGELGIPVSPATLRLPRFSERLSPPFVPDDGFQRAFLRYLGLAHSLAVAPSSLVVNDLPVVQRADVEQRAIDVAAAGQRTFLGEDLLSSLEVMALELLGNSVPLPGMDELRRRLDRGLESGDELARLLRWQQSELGIDAQALLDHLASTASYMDGFLAVLWIPDAPGVELGVESVNDVGVLAGRFGDPSMARTLPFGEVLGVSSVPGLEADSDLALVGAVWSEDRFRVRLSSSVASSLSGSLVVLVPDATGELRRVDLGRPEVPPFGELVVELGPTEPDPEDGGFVVRLGSDGPAAGEVGSSALVPLPPFRVIGARQDFSMGAGSRDLYANVARPNRYGQGLSYLFNRPPDDAIGSHPEYFRIRSTFDGVDVEGTPVYRETVKVGDAAFLQSTGRVVNVRYDSPVCALLDQETGEPLVSHVHLLDTVGLVDRFGNSLDPDVPSPVIESDPEHRGGLVGGRVLRGDGGQVVGATVQLVRARLKDGAAGYDVVLDRVGETTTDADGFYFFDFVEDPHPDAMVLDGFKLRAIVPEGDDPATEPAGTEEVGSLIRQWNTMARINIALLGRGAVSGSLVYAGTGEPVPNGVVTASSSLFNEVRSAQVEPDGNYEIRGLPVGPITVAGRDSFGRTAWATVGIDGPGDVARADLEILIAPPPGQGTVQGRVVARPEGNPTGPLTPVAGADVAVWSNGVPLAATVTSRMGAFHFDGVTAGQVTVQAASWEVSRTPVRSSFQLGSSESVDLELVLPRGRDHRVIGEVRYLDPTTGGTVPVVGANVFVEGPGVWSQTDDTGWYAIERVPEQASDDLGYSVTAIDPVRHLQGSAGPVQVTGTSPDEIGAPQIVLREMRGAIRGVVLDPWGRPASGVEVVAELGGVPFREVPALGDGGFLIPDLRLGEWKLTAHRGDGLATGAVGWIGEAETEIVFGGHQAFATVRLRGSGSVLLQVRTAAGDGVMCPVYYKPTVFSASEKRVRLASAYTEASTDPAGNLELELPVGAFEIVVYSPFHGVRTLHGEIEWAGQVRHLELAFAAASRVVGTVVDVDGVTPIADIPVTMQAFQLQPQTLRTDDLGRFAFELVPEGGVQLRVRGMLDGVERFAAADGMVTGGGQELEVRLRLKAQGSVRGRILLDDGETVSPLPGAKFYVSEGSHPHRTLPAPGRWYTADANGSFEIARLVAGPVRVVGWDGASAGAMGSVVGSIDSDWQLVELPDLVLRWSSATLEVEVRDPDTGAPLPDCQVRLERANEPPELSVSDASGVALYQGLPLGAYSVVAFHAPTGRTGRGGPWTLATANEVRRVAVTVDSRGQITGTLFDGPGFSNPVAGGVVDLRGTTAGGPLSAVASTRSGADVGRFEFGGIPEGSFELTAGLLTSPRRASTEVEVTSTSPAPDVNLVLEAVGDVWVRVYRNPAEGVLEEIDPASGVFAVELLQGWQDNPSHDVALVAPTVPGPGHLYGFPEVLTGRGGSIVVQELDGERRVGRIAMADFQRPGPHGGTGTEADPYVIVLGSKGVVRVTVHDGSGDLAIDAGVRLGSGQWIDSAVTSIDGTALFTAVPAGAIVATATSPVTGFGGRADGELRYDDDVLDLEIWLAPVVSAHGRVFLPTTDDVWNGDPSLLEPAADVWVTIQTPGGQLTTVSGADGGYRFEVLAIGSYSLRADSANGEAVAGTSGTLGGPDGADHELPDLILDASPPRILSITPPPGMRDVSPTAVVEILFSEALDPAVRPAGATSSHFEFGSISGVAVGTWSSVLDGEGRQVVRFDPSAPYTTSTIYTLVIQGGSGGVRDLAGRLLTESGNVGSTFTVADVAGPKVLGTEPDLGRPFDPESLLRVDLNEVVSAIDGQLDDEAVIEWMRNDGGWSVWPLASLLAVTREGYSLLLNPRDDYMLTDDSLLRRVRVERIEDSRGNHIDEPWHLDFRVRDGNPPVIDALPAPAGAPTGELSAGNAYALTPVLSGIDHFPVDPAHGDLDRVEFFFSDPVDPGVEPIFTASAAPWSFPFTATYAGGGEPQPRPIWARATDTSDNASEVARVDLVVLPNRPPTVGGVEVAVVDPVAGVAYAGSRLAVTIPGLSDPDGAQLTVSAELRRADGSGVLVHGPTVTVVRPASGDWSELPATVLSLTIPITEPEGPSLLVRVVARDTHGAATTVESPGFEVADDQSPPVIERIVARRAETLEPASSFVIGESLVVEVTVRDPETAVDAVEVRFDGILPSPVAALRVTGDLYRTAAVVVPHSVFDQPTAVIVTAEGADRGGNSATQTLEIELRPADDPTAPTVEWLTPWEGAPWPAAHTSSGGSGATPFLVRVRVTDTGLDGGPGELAAVELRGPVADGAGGAVLSASAQPGQVVAGTSTTGEAVYEWAWAIPDGLAADAELPFEVRAVDTGNLERVARVRMWPAPARRVYERVTSAVSAADAMLAAGGDPQGPVFLLDGTTLSLAPSEDGSPRRLPEVVLYAGADLSGAVRATVLTAPRVSSPASSRTFLPLELEIDRGLAVGAGARVDLSRCGVLGGDQEGSLGLQGPASPRPESGGSHGGRGWFGSPGGGWLRTDLVRAADAFDNLRDPRLPGLGGGGRGTSRGGQGGGVLVIEAPEAVVRLTGDVRADGEGGFGGGAGGSIRIVAARLEGTGLISARGGDGSDSYRSGGGGGGRVSLRFAEAGDEEGLAARVDVSGGLTGAGSNLVLRGGTGTVYRERAEGETGGWSGRGRALVTGPSAGAAASTLVPGLGAATVVAVEPSTSTVAVSPSPAGDVVGDLVVVEGDGSEGDLLLSVVAQTVGPDGADLVVQAEPAALWELAGRLGGPEPLAVHSRTRLASLALVGTVRAEIPGDLELGIASPMLNDRSAIAIDGGGRVRLRGETTSLNLTATPAAGGEVRVGSTVAATWAASDPLGIAWVRELWSAGDATSAWPPTEQPIVGVRPADAISLTVPPTFGPGPVTWRVTAADLDGRQVARELEWTVLPNEPPGGLLRIADGEPGSVHAGGLARVTVEAADAEGLAQVRLDVAGPSTVPQVTRAVSGLTAAPDFDLGVLENAAAGELLVTGVVRDTSGAETPIGPVSIVVIPDTEPPVPAIGITPVRAGDVYRSGDRLTVTVTATDDVRVSALELRRDGEPVATAAGPGLTWNWTAPPVAEDTLFELVAIATDPSGNHEGVTRTLTVQPNQNPDAPIVTIHCPFDGDGCAVGATTRVRFSLTDSDPIHSWWLLVDGVEHGGPVELPANTTSHNGIASWSPPADAQPGDSFELTLEARDFNLANVGRATIHLTVLEGTVLDGDQTLTLPFAGEHLILGPGTHLATTEVNPADLTLLPGAVLSAATGWLRIRVQNRAQVSCDALVDVSDGGYPGGTAHNPADPDGNAPDGVSVSTGYGGASHGGLGQIARYPGAVGGVYDSVCSPGLLGAGGPAYQYDGVNLNTGGRGGGALHLAAGALVLHGEIRASGQSRSSYVEAAGAGGTVVVEADSVIGEGMISAVGGSNTSSGGGGGGGRVALRAASLGSFDPAAQVRAYGGLIRNGSSPKFAGAGTIYVSTGSGHGTLIVDQGSSGTAPVADTPLPSIGTGVVGTVEVDGAEPTALWITPQDPAANFSLGVVGMWVRIENADYRVAAQSDRRRILLDGAAAVVAAGQAYQGVHKFDVVEVRNRARLSTVDLLETPELRVEGGGVHGPVSAEQVTVNGGVLDTPELMPSVTLNGVVDLGARLRAGVVTVASGAAVGSLSGFTTIEAGTVTVAAGGRLDVSERGYAGGTANFPTDPDGNAPVGVTVSTGRAGASHGGTGRLALSPGSVGEAYDSVFAPELAGAGGPGHQVDGSTAYTGGRGGGVLRLVVDSLLLDGEVRASGQPRTVVNEAGGAGGTVVVHAGTLSGSGVIRVSGGGNTGNGGSGGGGRVALLVDDLSGFDPVTQVEAVGGRSVTGDSPGCAGAGTIFVSTGTGHGSLIVDQRASGATAVADTPLPSIGTGVVGTVEVDGAEPTALWIAPEDPAATFSLGVVGMWVRIENADYRVVAQSDRRRILLEGAAWTVTPGLSYQGLYRFDSVTVRGRARLWVDDLDEFGELVVESGSSVRLRNGEDPTIVPGLVVIVTAPGEYRVSGLAGAVTDPDGISSARVVNTASGGTWPIAVAVDGSFPGVTVVGAAGDELRLEATDAHDSPRTATAVIGGLLVNDGGPTIAAGLEVVAVGATPFSYVIQGGPGSVSDPDLPVRLAVVNAATGVATAPVQAGVDGSFSVPLAAITPAFGDELRLEATDSHPNPLTSVVALGPMPDRIAPLFDASKIRLRVDDRAFWVAGIEGAARDENDGWTVGVSWLSGEHSVGATSQASGAFLSEPIVWPSGTEIAAHVTDVGNNSVSTPLGPLPANQGPPYIDLAEIHGSTGAPGIYEVYGDGYCVPPPIGIIPSGNPGSAKGTVNPDSAIHSLDTLEVARLENRTTPGFGPWTVTPFVGENCPIGTYYGFAPAQVDGAIGDEIFLVAEDGHPEWMAAEAEVWTLPQIPGNPLLALTADHLDWTGSGFELAAPAGSVTGGADPLTLEARVWRQQAEGWLEVATSTLSMASGDEVRLDLPTATAAGDLAVISATDADGRTTRTRLVVPAAVTFGLELDPVELRVGEYVGSLGVAVRLSRAPAGTVSVAWALVPDSALAGSDWNAMGAASGTFTFTPSTLQRTVTIGIVDDALAEPEERFLIRLSNPVGVPILGSDTAVVTIQDNDGVRHDLVRSVQPASGASLGHAVGMTIAGGEATFTEPLPWGANRGDRMETSVGRLYLDACSDERRCEVRRPDGTLPEDAPDAAVTWVEPAFTSLADAVRPSNHDWHGSQPGNLVDGNASMTLLCYRGLAPDIEPVLVRDWRTSSEHSLRIVAPTAADQIHGSHRHQGRWTDDGYRLVGSTSPLRVEDGSATGLIRLEGLQVQAGAGPDDHVRAISVWTAGRVEISETLVRLDGVGLGSGSRIGILAEGEGTTVVRNTAVWDLPTAAGGGESVGICGDGYGDPSLEVLNGTVIGGRVGVQRLSGAVRVVNTLAAGAGDACFDGEFTPDSSHNLATDGSAPVPPEGAVGAVSVRGGISGATADLHLACELRDQAVTITSSSQVGVDALFDGDSRTTIWPNEANPLWVRLEFTSPRTFTGTSVLASNCGSHVWSLEVADTVDDLVARTGSWREVVPPTVLENFERAFGTVTFEEPVTASIIQLNASRSCDANGVLLNEWLLHGLNPACSSGLDLGGPATDPVVMDVDTVVRTGPFDIGADQATDLEVRIETHPDVWYEGDGVLRIPVVLSERAPAPVRVRYITSDGGAVAGEDYLPVEGILRWEAGEREKLVEVPLVADQMPEVGEGFWLHLLDPDGVVVRSGSYHFVVLDGEPPARVQLAAPELEAMESDGVLRGEVEIVAPVDVEITVDVAAFSRTARISQDFISPFDTAVIPPGETRAAFEIELIQDTESEPTEEVILQLSWASNAEHGARAYAIGRIHDSALELPTVSFGAAAVTVAEAEGTVSVPIGLSAAQEHTVHVEVGTTGATAILGEDLALVNGPSLELEPGETTLWLELDLVDDDLDEVLESLTLTLSSEDALIGEPASLTVTIYDDEAGFAVWESNAELHVDACGAEVSVSEGFVEGEGQYDVWVEVITDGVSTWYQADHPVEPTTDTWVTLDRISTTSAVLVHVAAAGGDPDLAFGLGFEVYEPLIDDWDLEPSIADGLLSVTLFEWTVQPRYTDTTVLLRNLTTGVDVVPDDPCGPGEVPVSVPVSGPDDLVVLEACNGDPVLGLCATHQLNPEVRR